MLPLPFVFEKLGISIHFWSVLYILSGTRLENDIGKTLFINSSFVCVHTRGVHFVCVLQEYRQCDGFPGSQAARAEDQARACVPVRCCFWTEARAGPWIAWTTQAPEESILWHLACLFSSCWRPALEKGGERELVNCVGYLLASRSGFHPEIVYRFLWSIDKWPKATRRLWKSSF